ncbi:jg23157 [Pararge aegeria aegeria]|uniref:Jg23157 protein n=1 Tax=Pararge aegeria aegeria TaxID=348720 RepID=A0A8S4QPT7_9NEOP|nr:jg23157 [Pararge aegeria aegeria]
MSKFVRKFVENCMTCRLSKTSSGKVQAELHPIPKISVPWHTVHVDITGKLSGKSDRKEYVIVHIDAFTKFVLLNHTTRIDAKNAIEALKASVSLFGTPVRVIADQGRCFSSKEYREFCDSHNIKLHLIATGSSRANGQVERVMSTLKGMLTAVETSERSWQDALGEVQLAINCTISRVTKSSPLELLIGRVARPLSLLSPDNNEVEIDLSDVREQAVQNITKNSNYDKARFDATKAKILKFNVNDYVLLKNEERNQTKLDPKFKGPFKVIEILDGDRYLLKSLTGNRTYKYAHDRLRRLPECEVPLELDDDSDEHVDEDA